MIDFNFYLQKGLWGKRISVYIEDKATGAVCKNLVFAQVPEHEASEPSFDISFDAAQQLMDRLWDCGLRPSEGTGSAGSLAATERHLQDMRTLVFQHIALDDRNRKL